MIINAAHAHRSDVMYSRRDRHSAAFPALGRTERISPLRNSATPRLSIVGEHIRRKGPRSALIRSYKEEPTESFIY